MIKTHGALLQVYQHKFICYGSFEFQKMDCYLRRVSRRSGNTEPATIEPWNDQKLIPRKAGCHFFLQTCYFVRTSSLCMFVATSGIPALSTHYSRLCWLWALDCSLRIWILNDRGSLWGLEHYVSSLGIFCSPCSSLVWIGKNLQDKKLAQLL